MQALTITSGLVGAGFATISISDDDTDTGYKIFGGYKLSKNFAIEGGYFDLGRFGFTATTVTAGTLNGSIRFKGVNLDESAFCPSMESFLRLDGPG
jgi:OOP family OmpA-OmpF porin